MKYSKEVLCKLDDLCTKLGIICWTKIEYIDESEVDSLIEEISKLHK